MMRNLSLLSFLLLLSAACASPTAPTSTSAAPAVPIALYRWELVAPGCQVTNAPAPNLTNVTPTDIFDVPDGRRVIYIQGAARPNGEQDYIAGDFRRLDKVWALCSWNRYTRAVDRL